jgi:hypothetical protein
MARLVFDLRQQAETATVVEPLAKFHQRLLSRINHPQQGASCRQAVTKMNNSPVPRG